MAEAKLVDYDDLLMNALNVLRSDKDLLANIQEQFLYIMVDEFQDTNGVQQLILECIADNPVHESRPNIMVVGDDDQAIYGFQGAYSSNVLDFLTRWQDVTVIPLLGEAGAVRGFWTAAAVWSQTALGSSKSNVLAAPDWKRLGLMRPAPISCTKRLMP